MLMGNRAAEVETPAVLLFWSSSGKLAQHCSVVSHSAKTGMITGKYILEYPGTFGRLTTYIGYLCTYLPRYVGTVGTLLYHHCIRLDGGPTF